MALRRVAARSAAEVHEAQVLLGVAERVLVADGCRRAAVLVAAPAGFVSLGERGVGRDLADL